MENTTSKKPFGRAISCRQGTHEKIEALRKKHAPLANTALFVTILARVYETATKKQRDEAATFVVNE